MKYSYEVTLIWADMAYLKWMPGKFRVAFSPGSGSESFLGQTFSGADLWGTDRNSGASVERGVDGALEGRCGLKKAAGGCWR